MGEAKRRKYLDPNFGKSKYRLEVIVAKSHLSDGHAVWLMIENPGVYLWSKIICVHRDLLDAIRIAILGRKTLKSFKIPNHKMDNEDTVMRFTKAMIEEHGDWDSDDFGCTRNQEGFAVFTPPVKKRFVAVPYCKITNINGKAIDNFDYFYEPICSITKYKEQVKWTVIDNDNPGWDFDYWHDSYIDAACEAENMNYLGRAETDKEINFFHEELKNFCDKVRMICEEFMEPYPDF
ncbi:hypothetical protein BI308_25845 [Roseofilum reptotaenium AO1-A]|uniref:Uncharacterized protein n=1 Tax=Roseofilum reptotaenium AO1-A TaxID=1925591 RepID=A0A1L9QCB7_9CYAN|nr:hypothetical protein BI308_25845 [Roseofilum reptotaenium AO1-A]